MRTLFYAIGPMLFDSLGIIVFAVLLAVGAGIVTATVAGSIVAIAVVGYEFARGHKVAKISVVGVGMKSHAGVASTMFRALADRGINIQAISTSEIKVSVLIDEDETELAVRVLHTAYGLDAD